MNERTKVYCDNIPERDRQTLANLRPSDKSHMPLDRQQRIIDIMKADPSSGYAFLGPSGWSKSTFMSALYRHALSVTPDHLFDYAVCKIMNGYMPVVWVEAKHLLDQFQAWKIGEGPVPDITAAKIQKMVKAGVTPTLFIDEFEKIKKSEFRMGELYDVLNAMYKAKGRLYIAGNLTKLDLQDTNQFLEGTFRRIEDLTAPHFWEFGGKQ